MNRAFRMEVNGDRSLERMLGVAASSVKETKPMMEAIVNGEPREGRPAKRLVDKDKSLEGATEKAFKREGRNPYQGKWQGYGAEPVYARMKPAAGGGRKIGVWKDSKNPLFETFEIGHSENIASFDKDGFEFGSRRSYAKQFHEGGAHYLAHLGDGPQPARPILPRGNRLAPEIARAFQRYLMYRIEAEGRDPTEAINALRVEP